MIAVKIQGRLGNQLFQYAFIHASAKKLNTSFYIDSSVDSFLIPKYFDINSSILYHIDKRLFSIKGYKNVFNYHLKKGFYHSLQYLTRLQTVKFSNNISPAREIMRLKDKSLYEGFFQSEQYFAETKEEIKKLFRIKDEYKVLYKKASKNIPKNKTIIVVHIRKGDYISLGWQRPMSYYHEAINNLKFDAPFFIFISDQPHSINADFKHITDKYISTNDEIIDFQFMLSADVCILSNSTFSWWGAYLNPNKPKVIAPKFWCDLEKKNFFPRDIHLGVNWEWQ